MKNICTPKVCWLFLFMLSLLSCYTTNQCEEFNRQSEMMTVVFFPQELPNYEFARTDNPNAGTLRLTRRRFEFSEAYEEDCDDDDQPCDCYATHRTRYELEHFLLSFGNDLSYGYRDVDPVAATIRYLAFNQDGRIIDDLTCGFPPDDSGINRDINNLVEEEITINGETFNDVMVIELTVVNVTFFVERNKGLQGILFGGEIYRRID